MMRAPGPTLAITRLSRLTAVTAVSAITAFTAVCALPAPVSAQDVHYSLRPGVLRGDATTVGVRYELEASPPPAFSMRSLFPTSFGWAANLDGVAALNADVATEPIARGAVDAGVRVLLRRIGGCPPGAECTGSTGWDLGYILLGARAGGEASQRFDEVHGSAGASLLYRPSARATGIWPLVPSVILDYVIAAPVRSAARDSIGADSDAHRRFDLGLQWHARLGHDGVPEWLSLLRLEAEWRHFAESGVDPLIATTGRRTGNFAAAGLGIDVTGRLPYARDVFVRWSDGEHPTQETRRAWLLGIALGTSR